MWFIVFGPLLTSCSRQIAGDVNLNSGVHLNRWSVLSSGFRDGHRQADARTPRPRVTLDKRFR
jgi:hypothetical protein